MQTASRSRVALASRVQPRARSGPCPREAALGRKYDAAALRTPVAITAAVAASLVVGACGTQGISVSKDSSEYPGAVLFAERCAGCHTLTPAGTQGSDARNVRAEGPNLDQRSESRSQVLFAIRNGGFSGSIMPQNIVTGVEADRVADFVSKYAGEQSVSSPRPGQTTTGP
jgi:mono/diheme cytochrome c family protein